MQGVFASWRAGLLYLLAWLMLGLVMAALLAAGGAAWGPSLLFAVPLSLVYANATAFSSYYVCRAYPIGARHPAAIVAGVGFTAACAALFWCVIGNGWAGFWRAAAPGLGMVDTTRPLQAMMFGLGVILYVLAAAVNYLLIETERVRQLQTRELETRLMAQDAELRMLRTQVDPHFLFNSLNSISALTTIDARAARAMTVQLAEFFRHSLGLQADRMVTLDTELALVRHFLAIEQVRFGERLRFEAEVEADAGACRLPPMLLQPLVENAVKHGIGRMLGPGLIRLQAQRTGSLLRIRVENDVDQDDMPAAASRGSGIGLVNVRQRLAAAYGHEASTHWTREEGRFSVELVLPADTMEKGA
jgi:two-component system sensor histidine kinase AlgZ